MLMTSSPWWWNGNMTDNIPETKAIRCDECCFLAAGCLTFYKMWELFFSAFVSTLCQSAQPDLWSLHSALFESGVNNTAATPMEQASSHMGREKPRRLGLFWATHASQQCRVAAFPEGIATAADGKRSKTSAKIVARGSGTSCQPESMPAHGPELREVETAPASARNSVCLCFSKLLVHFIPFRLTLSGSLPRTAHGNDTPFHNIRRGGQESVAVEKRRRQFFKYTVHYTCPERAPWSSPVCMQKCASTRTADTYRVLIARVWF
uniref:Transmembrane protein n=1 Tax=Panagrellus redivivus TaxID=6233 RepID=A0A7E4VUY7_PANRE